MLMGVFVALCMLSLLASYLPGMAKQFVLCHNQAFAVLPFLSCFFFPNL